MLAPLGWRCIEAMHKIIVLVDKGEGHFIGHVVDENLDLMEANARCDRANKTIHSFGIRYHVI